MGLLLGQKTWEPRRMRRRTLLAIVAAPIAMFGAASWWVPTAVESVVGPAGVVIGQTIGIPVIWMISAGLNVTIMAGLIGLFALVGWLLYPRDAPH